MNIYKYISDKIKSAIGENAGLEIPKNPEFGDFATNAAMVAAKAAGRNPREMAAEIMQKIAEIDGVDSVSIAGPGFINIKMKDDFIIKSVAEEPQTLNHKPQTIDLDYGSYNVAKSMHIGHLRTSIVGDTFNRLGRFLGHRMISWNHMGDWGRPMALIIAWVEKHGIDIEKLSADELNKIYPAANSLAKEDAEFMARAHFIKNEFQNGNPEFRAVYDKFLPIALDDMNDVVRRLNMLPFDNNLGERNAAGYLDAVEEILRGKNMITPSEGAMVIPVRREDDNAPMPPMMWTDSRGADTYDSTDIAAAYCKKITDNPDRMIFFTDARQNLHFAQLFRVCGMSGIYPESQMEHVGYGTINGTDGTPLKTRDGNAAGLRDMINIANEAVLARARESEKTLPDETMEMIALAALKFNDLSHDVRSDYVFDPKQISSFDGRTGPYILYAAVRLNSVLARAESAAAAPTRLHADERTLLLKINDLENVVNGAFARRDPSLLANFVYDLAQMANGYYHNFPILRSDVDAETRAGRLWIVEKIAQALTTGLDLMGLRVPAEM
ncbi:MAG: arginine--tRNA ligase [Rickettsiales bacterium]|jgi:arginyl-tRNA synthetase|nr:arginine--tRNA ligase [Rickettsiales bacterium]